MNFNRERDLRFQRLHDTQLDQQFRAVLFVLRKVFEEAVDFAVERGPRPNSKFAKFVDFANGGYAILAPEFESVN